MKYRVFQDSIQRLPDAPEAPLGISDQVTARRRTAADPLVGSFVTAPEIETAETVELAAGAGAERGIAIGRGAAGPSAIEFSFAGAVLTAGRAPLPVGILTSSRVPG